MTMHRALSWVTTVPFLFVFGTIFLVFEVVQRIAHVFSDRAQEHAAGMLQVAITKAFAICGTRFMVERSTEIERQAAYLIVSNHQSMVDIAILGTVFYSNFPKYVSKDSLGKGIPSVSYNLRHGGHVLIDRNDPESAVDGIRELGRRVRSGRCSGMIFPEGTRGRTGELGRFKKSGLLALLEEAPDTPIVPVAIDESWRLLRYNYLPVPFGTRVRVHVGAPIERVPNEDRAALIERVRAEIDETLTGWRTGDTHARAA